MEVFKVFATMSLMDIISSPLKKIELAMKGVDTAALSTTAKLGKLALGMAPVAAVAGVVLFGLGSCVSVAADFEDQMAKVGAVSRATAQEMVLLKTRARELGATTMFSASQVGEAEMYLAMAGFTAAENVAALPGVLDMAAATATDLGRAADISSDILSAFGLKAAEMSRVADVLCLTTATANTNMELLGDTMKYVAPIARQAGMSLEETAAMAGLLGNVGIKGSMAGTSLKAMLNKMAAPNKRAQETFAQLGVSAKDAAGNLRSPILVLGELAEAMEGMGTADQIAAMKYIVGEEAISGFANLIEREGIGAITEYVKVLEGAGGSAAEMAARMKDTLKGALRGLDSAWESLQITIGDLFIPVIKATTEGLTALTGILDKILQNPVGAFFLKFLAALAAVVVSITLLAGGLFLLKLAIPLVVAALGAAASALAALAWPLLIVAGIVAAVYFAFKYNLGGITDFVVGWYNKVKLVFSGVIAVFKSLNGGVGELRGDLAKDIKAQGLLGVVTTIAKAFYRVKQLAKGFWDALSSVFSKIGGILDRVFGNLGGAFGRLGKTFAKLFVATNPVVKIFSKLFGLGVESSADSWKGFGEILGNVVGFAINSVVVGITNLVNLISLAADGVSFFASLLTGDFSGATDAAKGMLRTLRGMLFSIFDLFGAGDWFNSFVDGAISAFNKIFAGLSDVWNRVTAWLDSFSLFESGSKLLSTLVDGVASGAGKLVDAVSGALGKVRDYLPFSDAKKGPLSTLTKSGMALVGTLGEGVSSNAGALLSPMSSVLGALSKTVLNSLPELPSFAFEFATERIGDPDVPDPSSFGFTQKANNKQAETKSRTLAIHIANLVLPEVKEPEDFINKLQTLVSEYEGA